MERRHIARRCVLGAGLLALSAILTGCASAYARGGQAYRAGRYTDATREFEIAAARGAKRLDALTGLGVSRDRLGDLSGARDALQRVLAESPKRVEARIYLALVELERRDDPRALEELTMVRPLIRHPRIAAAVERAIGAIREGTSDTSRELIRASLDDAVEWARELRDARERAAAYAVEPYWTIYRDNPYEGLP